MVSLPYIDDEIARMDAGGAPPAYLRHFHWGHYDDLDGFDDSAEGYVSAAETMTERVVAAGRVADDCRILDVGCGFGGTLDLIRGRNTGCRLAGINIDERQLSWARRLLGAGAASIPFVTADGCVLPVRDAAIDHVLAVECIFHFPSRKAFFVEVARVLRPGGTWAFSITHPMRWIFWDEPGEDGLVARNSYFDRRPYVEQDATGEVTYVEQHRTLGDRVRELVAAGFVLRDLVEPEWPAGLETIWGQWSPLRGRLFPGTAIFIADRP